jgi:hypothetical protein
VADSPREIFALDVAADVPGDRHRLLHHPAPALESTPSEVVAPPTVMAAATDGTAAATTITGCLTFDDGNYRLKDVTGAKAPKSRSLKSGFLRKRSATIDVFDANHALGLANYV